MIIPSTFCGLECDQFFQEFQIPALHMHQCHLHRERDQIKAPQMVQCWGAKCWHVAAHVKNSSQSQFLTLAFTWSTPCQYPNARDLKRQSAATMKVSHLISWCVVHCKGHCRVKQNASSHNPWKVKNNAVLMEQNSLQMYMVTLLLNYKLT